MRKVSRATSFLAKAGIVALMAVFVLGFKIFIFFRHPLGGFSAKSDIAKKNNLIDKGLASLVNSASADVSGGGGGGSSCGCTACGSGGCGGGCGCGD